MTRWYPPSQDRMTTAERIEASRTQQQEAQARRDEVAKQTRSPMGFVRKQPDRASADAAVAQTHHAITDALSVVEEAMRRDRAIRDAEQAERTSDERRQPRSPR